MSAADTNDNMRVLYLQQIDIETNSRIRFIVKLKINNKDVEVQQQARTLTWTPSRSLEIFDTSRITMHARPKFIPFAKSETLAEIGGEEAMHAFWQSTDSISHMTTFDEQPTMVTFKFRPSPTSESTRDAVQRLQIAMDNYSSLMASSTEQRIDTAIRYGVAVSEMNPLAKVAFSLAKVTFDLLKEQRKYDGLVSDLASGIDRVLPFATQVLEDVLYDETELLDGAVRKLYELIEDTAKFIVSYAKRSPACRAAKSTVSLADHRKIDDLQSDFGKLKEDFDRAIDIVALKMARKKEEFRLLDRLKPTDAANYQESHSCMEGTRTAILDDIVAWVPGSFDPESQPIGSNSHNVLWLYGIPGLGKTSVANSLCDRLRRSGNLGGSFFCRRDDPILREPKRVLPTLISRLAGMWGPFRKLVAQALHDDPQLNPESMLGELLLAPLKSLKKHPLRTLVLVVDAFDECGEPYTRSALLNCLVEACSLVDWLKLVITSRPEYDIQSSLNKWDITSRDLGTDDPTGKDILHFTKRRMASIASHRHLPSDWPGKERLTHIVERSGGLFIFVETVSRFLIDDPDPEQPLALVLSGKLEETNAELHKLYSIAIASRIGPRTDAFRSVAGAIVVASMYRPLCDGTLGSLIGLESRIVSSWVDDLSSLLYRDASQKGGIRVRHLSVLEFLIGPSCPPEFRVDMKRANAELGLCCLGTMVKELRFNICELETSCLLNAEVRDLEDRVDQKISDTLQYSCMHWSSHLCSDSNQVSTELAEQLDEFFADERPLYWLEVLSLMGEVPMGIMALRHIKASAKQFEDRHRRLVDDILRFVLAFYTPISTSAPHIYISGLPFLPLESVLWKRASKSFTGIIHVCKGRALQWPAVSSIWQGHTDYVRSIAYSPDGRHVVSGSDDQTIRIWDAETGVAVGEPLKGHTNNVCSIAYSPDGRHVVSGSDDMTIRIWDAETGTTVVGPLKGHTGHILAVTYSPDGRHVVSGSDDQTIRIWDAETGAAASKPLGGYAGHIFSVAYSPDGRHIVSGSNDHTIRIWDAETGAIVGNPLYGHAGPVNSVTYSPDGRRIVSGSRDQTIRIWDAETGVIVVKPQMGYAWAVNSVTYSPDGRYVVSGHDDRTIRIWNAETGVAVGKPSKGHTGFVNSAVYSPDGRHIVSASHDYTIRIWDAETGAAVGEPLEGHTGRINGVACSPDSQRVISGSDDWTIRIWDAETGAAVAEPLEGHSDDISSVAYSPDGRHVVSGSDDQTIRIWDAETGVAVGEPLKGHTAVCSVAYSPDGRHVVSGSDDMTIQIWDVKTRAAIGKPLRGHTGYVYTVAYSPDGRHVVSGSQDETIRIWDVETGVAVGEPLRGHTSYVLSLNYSPDGRRIVSGSNDETIRIWNAETGAAVGGPLKGHTNSVFSVVYSLDGRHIISGCGDNTIRIWDSETGASVAEKLIGHTGSVNSVACSPDGRRIVSGSDDRTIRIWDAEIEAAVWKPLGEHRDDVRSIVYSQDGQPVVPSSEDEMVRIWDVEKGIEKDGHGPLPGPGDVSSDPLSLTAFSGLPIPAELLDSNGCVRVGERLLFWVPDDCRDGLTSQAIITIPDTGRQRRVLLDFTYFQYGNSWSSIHARDSQQS